MKKIITLLAAVFALTLVSCSKEKDYTKTEIVDWNGKNIGKSIPEWVDMAMKGNTPAIGQFFKVDNSKETCFLYSSTKEYDPSIPFEDFSRVIQQGAVPQEKKQEIYEALLQQAGLTEENLKPEVKESLEKTADTILDSATREEFFAIEIREFPGKYENKSDKAKNKVSKFTVNYIDLLIVPKL